MRAYAFSGRNKIVLAILSFLFCGVIGTHIWFFWVNIPTLNFQYDKFFDMPGGGGFGCFIDYRAKVIGFRALVSISGVCSGRIILSEFIFQYIRGLSRLQP